MKDNVIVLSDLEFQIKSKHQPYPECSHNKRIIDLNGQIITCAECNKQLVPFWVLETSLRQIESARSKLSSRTESLITDREEFDKKHRYLKVIKDIERAWRGMPKYDVCCPHCHAGILPEDGLGSTKIHPDLELKRRRDKQ